MRHIQSLLALVLLLLSGCSPRPAALPQAALRMPTLAADATRTPAALPSPTVSFTATRQITPTTRATATDAATATPRPTITPTLPPGAAIQGIYGYGQLFALSCEARSASDWARHFGVTIRELEFLARLPRSNNPEEGFVGSLNGGWGNIPPSDYGVHAVPVAKLLREFGAQAAAMRNMTFDQVREEIAAGRPVMVWVTGHVAPGKGQEYVVGDQTIIVARYEHTVIVIGYDEENVTILDGKKVYQRPIQTFLDSWSALENMAIIWKKE